jgi:hypothetical protein
MEALPHPRPDAFESTAMTDQNSGTARHIELTETYAAHNYHP